jgi:AP endonuclease-1
MDEISTPSPKQTATGSKGSHKRALSNGTPGSSPARRSKRQRSNINLKEASSSEASDREVDQDFAPRKETLAKSAPKSARAKKTSASVKKEAVDDTEIVSNIKIDKEKLLVKSEEGVLVETETEAATTQKKPAKRRKKTKEEKEAEAMPLAPRTKGLKMFVGAHVSAAKGVFNSIHNSEHIG